MFDKELCPQQLQEISDDLLDALITEQAETHFDEQFYTLGQALMDAGQADIFMEVESAVIAFLSRVAEQAFQHGHEHGYVWAAFDMIETLRPLGLVN